MADESTTIVDTNEPTNTTIKDSSETIPPENTTKYHMDATHDNDLNNPIITPSEKAKYGPKEVDMNTIAPFCGVICFVMSLYTDFPACIGCAGSNTCLCFQKDFIMCKPVNENPNMFWLCERGESFIGPVEVCWANNSQCFIFDMRGVLPPVESKIPPLVTCCFYTLYFKGKNIGEFNKTIGELGGL